MHPLDGHPTSVCQACPARLQAAGRSSPRAWVIASALLLVLLAATACDRRPDALHGRMPVAQATGQTSDSCRECHVPEHEAWKTTDHALANRPSAAAESRAMGSFPQPLPDGAANEPRLILGHLPLWQPLVASPGGRWQPHELAFDPAKQEWFNVFGTENRQPGEWGHWTGRGKNWNSMCAQCHMTGYQKNYSAATDSYRSSWVEHGVGCIQCHGPTQSGHGGKNQAVQRAPAAPYFGDRQKIMQTCATCHARAEALTADFQPGDDYDDHYRVVLPVESAVYYPDGQQRDEDFNWTSVRLSRMGHAGVTCLDCHDPHTNKTILPAGNNQLCLQCHAAPGRVQPNQRRAVPIDPVAHSHHAEGSAGNACVSCHMPTTNYMQRAPRHDHGWLKPDPLLTKELGIPNACSRCHADKPLDWSIARAEEWYGAKLESRQRARARGVAAAQAGQPQAEPVLHALLDGEDIPAWRATLLTLLAPYAENAATRSRLEAALAAPDAMERAAAVRALTGAVPAERLRPLLKDPVRLVRLDAAWALSADLPPTSAERKELDAYLDLSLDQPSGRIRRGQDLANRGKLPEAATEMRRALEWDPNSPGIWDNLGMVLSGLGQTAEAAAKFGRAAELSPTDGMAALRAGLAFHEAGNPAQAEAWFRQATRRDVTLHRAWYNLGLLLAQGNRLGESAAALRQAANQAAGEPDYTYALATVLLRAGDLEGARAAAEATLRVAPGHQGAQGLLQAVRGRR